MTPQEWLVALEDQLYARQDELALMDAYYTGDHPLPFLTRAHSAKMKTEFLKMIEDSRSNFMELVVDVVAERLQVDGFRLSAEEDPVADKESWRIWQANQMDLQAQTAFDTALVKGVSYLSVWPGDDGPEIAVEDPSQTIVGYEPGWNYRRRAAAVKMWADEWTGMDRANVYLPDGIYKFEAKRVREDPGAPRRNKVDVLKQQTRWKELDDSFVPNPLGVVPIIPLRNRPRLLCEGRSELCSVYRVQNQINGFLFLLALAGYFGAHKQRWATGITLMEENGKAVEPWDVAVDRILVNEAPDGKFGEFDQTDLSGYLKAIEQKVQHIAITTRTPKHYLLPEGQEPSGDSIKSAESGLVKKVEKRQGSFGEGLEEAMRLARRASGATDNPVDSEVVWADPQTRSEAEITDAAIKRFQAQLTPWAQTMQDLGYTQTEIGRMSQEREKIVVQQAAPAQDALAAITAQIDQIRATLQAQPAPEAPDVNVTVEIQEGAIQSNMNDGAVQMTIDEGAISTTIQQPPAPKPRSAEITRNEDGSLSVQYEQGRALVTRGSDGTTQVTHEEDS